MAPPERNFQNARFFLLIDGLPYILCEEPAPIYCHIRMSGDLNSPSEYMGLKINGEVVAQGNTGFEDSTLRTFGSFDVTQNLKNPNGPIQLEAYEQNVGAFATDTLQAHFVHPFGEPVAIASATPEQFYEFTDLYTGNSPQFATAAPLSSCVCLTKRSLSLGTARIDLQTYAQTGYTMTAGLRDPNGMLSDLFASRKTPKFYNAANKSAAETNFNSLNYASTAGDAGQWYFTASETMFATGWAPTALTMIRGCYGSTAEAVQGASTAGQNIYTTIPGYTGRKAHLWVGYKMPNGFTASSSSSSQLDWSQMGWESFEKIGTFRLDDAPEYDGEDRFNLSFSDFSTYFANRKAMVNMRPVKSRYAFEPTDPTDRWVMPTQTPDNKKLQKGSAVTWALAKSKIVEGTGDDREETEVTGVFAYNWTVNQVELFLPEILGLFDWTTLPDHLSVSEVSQVFAIKGDPIRGILTILNSGSGDGTLGTYDQLFGVPEPTEFYEETFRMGAAIDEDDIDVASFNALVGLSLPWTYILTKEIEVGQLLSWLCTSTRCCWFASPDGKLTMKPFDLVTTVTETAGLVQIDSNDVLRATTDSGSASEANVASSFKIKTNYDVEGSATQEINFQDIQTLKKYPSADKVTTYEMPFLQTETSTAMRRLNTMTAMVPISINDLEFEIRRKMKMNERGVFTCSVVLPWKYADIQVADKIKLSNPGLFNFDTGKQSALSVFFVHSKQMNINSGTISLELVALYSGRSICQAYRINSYDAPTQRITLIAGAPYNVSGYDPTEHFAAGMNIRIFDASTSTFHNEVIDSILNGTQMTLAGTPSATYAPSDIITLALYGNNNTGPAPFPDPEEDGIFCTENGRLGTLSGINDDGSRWS